VESAGVDWLTCHVPHDRRAEHIADWGDVLLRAEQRAGNDRKVWKWNGYHGWKAGGVALGGRPDGVICRLSGTPARENWRHVYAIAGRCSRLDLQVTISGVPVGLDLAGEGKGQVEAFRPPTGRPGSWAYTQTRDSGATLYLGSRTSQSFGRLYDKSAEEDGQHLGGRWRYELELKEETAQHTATGLSAPGAETARAIATVHEGFSSRGVQPRFGKVGTAVMTTPPREQSDDQRRLEWLSGQVRSVVSGLILRGREADVLRALGLVDVRSPINEDGVPSWTPAAAPPIASWPTA
jgi:DNA relaxase NicK